MPMPNLDPSFELGKRLSTMEQAIRSVQTKQFPMNATSNQAAATGFAVPTAVTTFATAVLDVPAGFTTAIILGNAEVFVQCQPATATGDYGYAGMEINSSDGQSNSSGASGIWGTATGSGQAAIPVPTVAQFPSCTAVFSKLPAGATISTSVQVWSGLGWAAAPSNLAEVRALAFFLP